MARRFKLVKEPKIKIVNSCIICGKKVPGDQTICSNCKRRPTFKRV